MWSRRSSRSMVEDADHGSRQTSPHRHARRHRHRRGSRAINSRSITTKGGRSCVAARQLEGTKSNVRDKECEPFARACDRSRAAEPDRPGPPVRLSVTSTRWQSSYTRVISVTRRPPPRQAGLSGSIAVVVSIFAIVASRQLRWAIVLPSLISASRPSATLTQGARRQHHSNQLPNPRTVADPR